MGVDLTTVYLGFKLRNPLIVAACPLTRESQRLMELEQAGAAAAVMYSLFAEQVESDALGQIGHSATQTGGVNVAPLPLDYVVGVDAYLKNIELAKKSVSMPIIASLNGSDVGDWINFASLMEQAGADALELNIYFVPTDPNLTASQVESRYCDIVAAVRDQIQIPLSVKLGPFFSSLPNFTQRLADLNVDGLVLFNRFLQPDIDVNTLEVAPRLTLSSSDALRLPLRWIAILRQQLSISLAASSGAHDAIDMAKLILAGADVVGMASALLANGPRHVTTVLNDLATWMEFRNFDSIAQVRGAVMRQPGADSTAFERANYIKSIISYDAD